jgi:ABC-type transport system involved in multi-copper enzyme maturation permease subunit
VATYLLGIVGSVSLLLLGGVLSSRLLPAGVIAPRTAFHVALAGLQGNWTTLFQQALADTPGNVRPPLGYSVVGVFVLCAWVLVPTLLGVLGYERSDLDR